MKLKKTDRFISLGLQFGILRAFSLCAVLLISDPAARGLTARAEAPPRQVLDLFSQAAFPGGELRKIARVIKWTDPVRLGVVGEGSEEYLPILQQISDQLSVIDGLQMSADTKGDANVLIVLSKNPFQDLSHAYSDYFRTFFSNRESMDQFIRDKEHRQVDCFVRNYADPTGYKLTRGFMVIDTRAPNDVVEKCMASQTMILLGFGYRTEGLRSATNASVLSQNRIHSSFTESDMAMIKLLYAKEIRPGMNFDETMEQAHKVLDVAD